MKNPKLIVTGYGQHGKDTFCEALAPLTFKSSSLFVCEKAVYPHLKTELGYLTMEACYQDRGNHRSKWFDYICEYNAGDPARLARELFAGYDIYCGLRNREELIAAKHEWLFDLSIWIDAGERKPPEGEDSITIKPSDCDIVITNNGTEAELKEKAARLLSTWMRNAA